jgi:hypothetical protein
VVARTTTSLRDHAVKPRRSTVTRCRACSTPVAVVDGQRQRPLGRDVHHERVEPGVVTDIDGDRASAVSKGIGIMADGSCGSVTYDDTPQRGPAGWRITHRRLFKPTG